MNDVSIELLAKKIARDIFECGNEPESPTNRIEFKGKKDIQGGERAQGGLCFIALADRIEMSLRDY